MQKTPEKPPESQEFSRKEGATVVIPSGWTVRAMGALNPSEKGKQSDGNTLHIAPSPGTKSERITLDPNQAIKFPKTWQARTMGALGPDSKEKGITGSEIFLVPG